MAVLMIRCPETGRSIRTQYEIDPRRFRFMPVFFARSYCPLCRTTHEWFAREAWLESNAAHSDKQLHAL